MPLGPLRATCVQPAPKSRFLVSGLLRSMIKIKIKVNCSGSGEPVAVRLVAYARYCLCPQGVGAAGVALHLADDLPGTGSKASDCNLSDTAKGQVFTTASEQIVIKLDSHASGQKRAPGALPKKRPEPVGAFLWRDLRLVACRCLQLTWGKPVG
jgi:hypothetical protein